MRTRRAWGFYEELMVTKGYRVKRLVFEPGGELSYQKHFHRAEHWYIAKGFAFVVLNDNPRYMTAGDSIDIGIQDWHALRNIGSEDVVVIEIQTGDYFDDLGDIERRPLEI